MKYNELEIKGKVYVAKDCCRYCFGRGYTGIDANQHKVPCNCLKLKEEEKK